jgi:hypothetical protein
MRLRDFFMSALVILALTTQAAASECDPNDPTLLLPDLVALPPSDIRVRLFFRHRLLYFTTTIANEGDGPLTVVGGTEATQQIQRSDGTFCTHAAGSIAFNAAHGHFHMQDFASYLLRKDDPFTGEIVGQTTKVSFCLLDDLLLSGFNTQPTIAVNCMSPVGPQGIDVGWADVYERLLPGQQIDLDADPTNPVPAGDYFLVNVPNPDKVIWEKDYSPETSDGIVSIYVPGPAGQQSSQSSGGVHSPHVPHMPHTPRGSIPETSAPPAGSSGNSGTSGSNDATHSRPPPHTHAARSPHPSRASARHNPSHPH